MSLETHHQESDPHSFDTRPPGLGYSRAETVSHYGLVDDSRLMDYYDNKIRALSVGKYVLLEDENGLFWNENLDVTSSSAEGSIRPGSAEETEDMKIAREMVENTRSYQKHREQYLKTKDQLDFLN
jgi:hypothetical protein